MPTNHKAPTAPPVKLDGTPKKRGDRPGRPPKLTQALITQIADVVRTGCYLDSAARYCGVSKASFHEWMKRGHDQQRGIYRQFLDALEQAQASADVRDHARLAKAGEKDWRSIVEHLRLRNPARYARTRTEHTGADGAPIAVQSSVEASLLDTFKKLVSGDGEDEG